MQGAGSTSKHSPSSLSIHACNHRAWPASFAPKPLRSPHAGLGQDYSPPPFLIVRCVGWAQARGIASAPALVGGHATSTAAEPSRQSAGGSTPGKASQAPIPLTVAERARAAAAAMGAHLAVP